MRQTFEQGTHCDSSQRGPFGVLCAARVGTLAHAQGVTTGSINGIVVDAQKQPVAGASVIAVHEPSGTNYEATTRADGRFSIPNMRVGGPYTVVVSYVGAGTAFEPQTLTDVMVNLGVGNRPADRGPRDRGAGNGHRHRGSDTVFSSAGPAPRHR